MFDASNRKKTALKIAGFILAFIGVLLVVLFKGFENVPKGLNEVLFVWAVIGIVLLLRHQNELKNRAYLYICLIVMAFMVFWRVFFLNVSSRYSSGLIFPFVIFASFFLCNGLGKRRRPLVRLALFGAIVGSTVCMVWMNFNGLTRNHYCNVVAEILSGIDSTKENHIFAVEKENFFRIGVIGGLDRADMEATEDETPFDEYLAGYTRVYPDTTIVNFLSRGAHAEPEKNGFKLTKIVSLCENPKKQKYRLLYSIVPDSANRCVLIPEGGIAPQASGLLENGDFEVLDTLEESAVKLELCLTEGVVPSVEGFRTPRNAYFFTPPPKKTKLQALLEVPWEWLAKIVQPKPKRPPECNVVTESAIDGNNSARIQAPGLPARLMFERKFPNGIYECSLLVRGSRGTEIAVLCDECRNGERKIVPVATAILTDKRLYRITARFSVEGLADGDSFQFGVEVAKGEADIDDVTLTEVALSPP